MIGQPEGQVDRRPVPLLGREYQADSLADQFLEPALLHGPGGVDEITIEGMQLNRIIHQRED